MNGIIINGKAYVAESDDNLSSCANCDLKPAAIGCPYAETCITWKSVFRFSQELTDRLNGK